MLFKGRSKNIHLCWCFVFDYIDTPCHATSSRISEPRLVLLLIANSSVLSFAVVFERASSSRPGPRLHVGPPSLELSGCSLTRPLSGTLCPACLLCSVFLELRGVVFDDSLIIISHLTYTLRADPVTRPARGYRNQGLSCSSSQIPAFSPSQWSLNGPRRLAQGLVFTSALHP